MAVILITAAILALFMAVVTGRLVVGVQAARWCVAWDGASNEELQVALDYACGSGSNGGGIDCSAILPAGSCYQPDNLMAHASYAFNSYYHRSSQVQGSCDFAGTAITTDVDPGHDSCVYQSYSSQSHEYGDNAPDAAPTTPPANVLQSPPAMPDGATWSQTPPVSSKAKAFKSLMPLTLRLIVAFVL